MNNHNWKLIDENLVSKSRYYQCINCRITKFIFGFDRAESYAKLQSGSYGYGDHYKYIKMSCDEIILEDILT